MSEPSASEPLPELPADPIADELASEAAADGGPAPGDEPAGGSFGFRRALAKVREFPHKPGVYLMKDAAGNVLYVGKAKSLRTRTAYYFSKEATVDPRTSELVKHIRDIDFIPCETEVDALLREARLVKDLRPKFNKDLKDGKSFPYIQVRTREEFPRVEITRTPRRKGVRLYGPFLSKSHLKDAVNVLQKVLRFRTCSLDIKSDEDRWRWFRPCLLHSIRQQTKKRARSGSRQRPASGIVDGDVPPPQFCSHAPRQIAIRRHQRAGLPLALQHFAQHQRDDGGFLRGVGRIDKRQSLQPLLDDLRTAVRERPPRIGRRRRPERFAQHHFARRRRPIAAAPNLHRIPRNPDGLEQLPHSELRMTGIDTVPTGFVQRQIESRQNHRTHRQVRNDVQQFRRRRNAAGRTRSDHRSLWRLRPQSLRQRAQRRIAMDDVILSVFRGEQWRPLVAKQQKEG